MAPLVAIAPLAGILLNMAVHIGIFRRGWLGFYHAVLAGFGAGGAAVTVLLLASRARLSPHDLLGGGLLAVGGYVGLSFGYFTFVNLSRTSVHIRMVRELYAAPGHTLPLPDLLARYGADQVLDARLERLVANGQVLCAQERYVSGPRTNFLRIAHVMDICKLILLGRRTLFCPPRTAPPSC